MVKVPSAAESSVETNAERVASASIAVSNSAAIVILFPPTPEVFVIPLIVKLKDEVAVAPAIVTFSFCLVAVTAVFAPGVIPGGRPSKLTSGASEAPLVPNIL